MEEFDPDIVSIQELKLNQEQANLYLSFDGYIVHYKPRKINPTNGWGVAVIVKNSIIPAKTLNFDTIKKYSELGPEILWEKDFYTTITGFNTLHDTGL